MREVVENKKKDRHELRRFGVTFSIVCLVWGGLALWRGKSWYPYFFIASPVFIITALILPVALKPIKVTLHALLTTVTRVVTWVALFILFYLVVTPIGLLSRAFRKVSLDLKFKDDKGSFWIPRENIPFRKETCEKQF